MTARTKSERLKQEAMVSDDFFHPDYLSRLSSHRCTVPEPVRYSNTLDGKDVPEEKENHPVIKHLNNLQEQLSGQLNSLNTVLASMQRISDVMERIAKNRSTLK